MSNMNETYEVHIQPNPNVRVYRMTGMTADIAANFSPESKALFRSTKTGITINRSGEIVSL